MAPSADIYEENSLIRFLKWTVQFPSSWSIVHLQEKTGKAVERGSGFLATDRSGTFVFSFRGIVA